MNTPEEYQQKIARLTAENTDLRSKIGPASYDFKDGVYTICLGYHPPSEYGPEGFEWLEVVDKAEVARLKARLAEVEGAVREWQEANKDGNPPSMVRFRKAEVTLAALALEAPRE